MLGLAAPTDPAWAKRVLADVDELLVDHAHCEKKAAGMAVQLIFRYTQHAFLHEPLSRLAREELAHFEEVLGHLEARGVTVPRTADGAVDVTLEVSPVVAQDASELPDSALGAIEPGSSGARS